MDELVQQAMRKWPNVPACYGWLGLDGRGRWFMRDDRVQQCGSFASQRPGSRGDELQHGQLLQFIGRNYAADAKGQWYFQNGPQRVYVELAHTPYIWRIEPDGSVLSHTGLPAEVLQVWLDEVGRVYLHTRLGFGLVHTLDTQALAQHMEAQGWQTKTLASQELPARFGYVQSPQQRQGEA